MTSTATKHEQLHSDRVLQPGPKARRQQLSPLPPPHARTLNQGWKMHLVNSEFQAPLYSTSVSTSPD